MLGVGKLALLRAVHRLRNPAGAFHVLDAIGPGDHDWLARALGELLEGEGSLVIRHADHLSAVRLRALSITLEQTLAAGRQKVLWVAVTLSRSAVKADLDDLAGLLQFFPNTVELPPLRHHIEDLHELVPSFLARLSYDGPLVCSPEAMQLAAPVRLAGQRRAALAGTQARGPPPAHRDYPPEGPAARVLDGEPQAAQPAGVDGARCHRAEPAGQQQQQAQDSWIAGHVTGDDLPQDPRVRDRHSAS